MYDLSKAFHDEKCAEYDLLLYQYNKLKAYVEANPDEKVKQLQDELVKYKRRCELIYDIGCDYDGFDTESASSMRDLVDELVEITPENIRLRKKILDPTERLRASRK